MSRLFTDQELEEMGRQTLDKVKDAIDSGDKNKAKELAQSMYDELAFLHDGATCWIAGLLTHIYKNYGVDALEAAEREAHTIEGKIAFKPLGCSDFKFIVKHTAKALHGHVHQPMTIEEDDEKVTITVNPCGSGGRLIQNGAYEPEIGMAKVQEAHHITYGKRDWPIYCVHCPAMEMLEIEGTGNFRFVHPLPENGPKGPICKYLLYKNPADIPEEYYKRIGKTKPKVK